MKRLVIIDGKSVFYRGYYAMGALSLADGTPTGGVYGFAAIAMEIVKKLEPTKVVVAWDKAKTSTAKRKAIFSDYKAGRVKPPEDFFAQIPLLRELIADLGWSFLECDEYEADDIIGTLAEQASGSKVATDERWETYIISSDLDMLQIVDEYIKMYRLVKGFSEIQEMDVAAVEEKYGIRKAQFLDLKALKGDASDNIPGVPGIGEKTAVKLLNDFGTLEGIYENLDKVKGAMKTKLEAGKDSAMMSKELATIMFDAPVSLEEIPDFEFDKEKVREGLEKLEFRSLIHKFGLKKDEEKKERLDDLGTTEKVEDVLVEWNVKKRMHDDEKFAKKIFGGEKFWDLNQGSFLLDPLARKEEISLFDGDKTAEYLRQKEEFEKYPRLYEIFDRFDLPLIPVLFKMEKKGMKISKKYFLGLQKEFEQRVQELEKEIWQLAGKQFNVNSAIQLSEILFSDLGLPTKGIKKTTRGYSTGAKELEKLKGEHPIVEVLQKYREAAKLLSTYIIPLQNLADDDERIHTTLTQDVTATGRLSSVNPNLQNIPVRTEEGKRIREGFVADEGKVLINADYSQFELRLAAVLAGDEELIKNFNSGIDIHTKTASEAFNVPFGEVTKNQRRAAKVINFGVLYGMSAKSLAEQAEMSVQEAKEFIDRYFDVRKPIKKYLEQTLEKAREEGFVETFFGRRRPTPDVKSANFLVRMAAERAAQNMPIQGTEADLVKRAMILLDQELPEGADLVMQVHDSLMVECLEEQAEEVAKTMKWVMENIAPELPIKLAVDTEIAKHW
ncbi:hypothetical protein IJF86_03305 [Candidatus Saccharibacteria bacterium]|nr:hypothetical protein [Candidatus Saccharibacteria bacterium]